MPMRRVWLHSLLSLLCLLALSPIAVWADEPAVTLTVRADRPGPAISPTLWGIFFEDINLGADGGLVAELVKNGSFEFPDSVMGWSPLQGQDAAAVQVCKEVRGRSNDPQNLRLGAVKHYLRLSAGKGGSSVGVINAGFRGIGVREGETYRFSVLARQFDPAPLALRVALVGAQDTILAEAELKGFVPRWERKSCELRARTSDARARLELRIDGAGPLDLDLVSLEPEATWKGRHPGLRADLVQLLADLKPGFVRFPGGCIVEGKKLDTRYQWKTTIGPPEDRTLIVNRWNDEIKHRPTPDYFQSFALGFFEYFQLCEDIGAAPLPVLNCGMACQFNSGELTPLEELDPFVQDALDLVEFANGPATSPWGEKRAEIGHPEPFHMTMLAIGNEQWGPAYIERYESFARVFKDKHPEIKLIASAGPSPADERFRFAWEKFRGLGADIIDEHCYDRPDWFFRAATRYDAYDRTGPKVFMGEYAVQSDKVVSPNNRNTWECALAEAAFMTGLERNADVVVMSSYAPLFAHVDGWQWTPDLIWFDNLSAYGTPSYYVQQLFSRNRGDVVLPVSVEPAPAGSPPTLYVTASREQGNGALILKVVNSAAKPLPARVELEGFRAGSGSTTVLASDDLPAENSLQDPRKVAPSTQPLDHVGATISHTFPARSVTLLRLEGGN